MKNLVLIMAVSLVIASVGVASAQSTLQNQFQYMAEAAKMVLGLTPEQDKTLNDIHSQTCAEAERISGSSVSDEEKQARLTALFGKFLTSSMAVLTPEQMDMALTGGVMYFQSAAGFNVPKAEVAEKCKSHKMTDAQINTVLKSLADHTARAAQVGSDATLSADGKSAQLWVLRQETFESARAGLDPDQQRAATALLSGLMDMYSTVKTNLTQDQKPKFDAFVDALLVFLEQKVTIQ